MAFGDIVQYSSGGAAADVDLDAPVSSGNSLILLARYRSTDGGLPTEVLDNINQEAYTQAFSAGDAELLVAAYYLSSTESGLPIVAFTGSVPFRWFLVEIEGAISEAEVGGDGYSSSQSSAVTTSGVTFPANSVSFGIVSFPSFGSFSPDDTSWNVVDDFYASTLVNRADPVQSSGDVNGSILGGDSTYAAAYAAFIEASTTPTLRKGSTFDVETTLGTVTAATLNGQSITVGSQSGTTVTLTDSDGSITTSGEYDLVLTDDSADPDETIAVQVNVVGLASYNINKDGADQASLTDVEFIIMTGAVGSRTIVEQITGVTTDTNGDTGAIEVTDLSLDVGDTVLVLQQSDTVGGGIPHEATLVAI